MTDLDRELMLWLNGFAGEVAVLDHFARLLASDYLVLAIVASAAFGLWFAGTDAAQRVRYQRATLIAAGAIGLSNAGVWILSLMFERTRPYEHLGDAVNLLFYRSTDPSFPANPVAVAFAGAGAIWLGSRRTGYAALVLAVLYAVARVYVGANYPGDVLGGALIGVVVTALMYGAARLMQPLVEGALRVMRGIAGA